MRILVVDDEPMVLGAIKRLLLTFRPTPEVIAEPGGASAVARMTDEQFDLIITDMEMPGMNGAAVLAHVRENYPHMVRVVLSGYAEPASGLQAVALAHRYLAKPCTVQDLSETIRSAREIHDALEPPDVRTAITGLTALPTAPPLYSTLARALRRPNCTVQEVTDVVMQDDAIAAKVLQVVNSAYFGLAQPVTGLHDAVAYLGLNTLRTLVLSVEAFRLFGRNDMCPGFDPAAHHGHVLLTARIATQLMDTMEDREDALTGALLHDIGKLLLASRLPARYSSVMARLKTRPVPSERAELEEGLPGHAAVGAHLLSLWGLPAKVVDMVAHHHDTAYLRSGGWGPAVAVHVADVLVHEQMVRLGREPAGLVSADLPALLTALGRMGDYPAWQELTADEATRVDGEEEIL